MFFLFVLPLCLQQLIIVKYKFSPCGLRLMEKVCLETVTSLVSCYQKSHHQHWEAIFLSTNITQETTASNNYKESHRNVTVVGTNVML